MTDKKPADNPYNIFAITIRSILVIAAVAAVSATLFSAWVPVGLDAIEIDPLGSVGDPTAGNESTPWPTATERPRPRIGIVAGHWGFDSGATCPDGQTEVDLNLKISTLTQQLLLNEGYTVDLLREFDTRLDDYNALALISIHADSCDYVNDQATGFKVAATLGNSRPDRTARLLSCIKNRYQAATNLPIHSSITNDMTYYHAFNEVNEDTPAIIIETGFMNLDRRILTEEPESIAQGIAAGALCYLRNESIIEPTAIENEFNE